MAATDLNTLAAWIGVLLGFIAGVFFGRGFHDEKWLGGYSSWPRRMLRLGHISFFGIAAINLAYALTITHLGWPTPHPLVSVSLAAANVLMPLACFAAAWRRGLRAMFAVPVVCVFVGVVGLLWTRLAGVSS
jgi:hypothetical protein